MEVSKVALMNQYSASKRADNTSFQGRDVIRPLLKQRSDVQRFITLEVDDVKSPYLVKYLSKLAKERANNYNCFERLMRKWFPKQLYAKFDSNGNRIVKGSIQEPGQETIWHRSLRYLDGRFSEAIEVNKKFARGPREKKVFGRSRKEWLSIEDSTLYDTQVTGYHKLSKDGSDVDVHIARNADTGKLLRASKTVRTKSGAEYTRDLISGNLRFYHSADTYLTGNPGDIQGYLQGKKLGIETKDGVTYCRNLLTDKQVMEFPKNSSIDDILRMYANGELPKA